MGGTNPLDGQGSDAAVLGFRDADDRDTGKSIAVCTDGNGRLTFRGPYNGGAAAAAEAARNVVCSGAVPLAVTNCLNFGNPEKPAAYFQLARAIDGMTAAARALGTPVISGNVSLYNESFGQGIVPTPVVGMVGLIEGRAPTASAVQDEGDVVALLGVLSADPRTLNGSAYLAALHGMVAGAPPQLDLDAERALQELTLAAIASGHIRSAHDCSDGGLAVALAECCMWSGLGSTSDGEVEWAAAGERLAAAALLFGEAPSRIVVSLPAAAWGALAALASAAGVPLTRLGTVGGTRLRVAGLLDHAVDDLHAAWHNGLAEALRGGVANVTVGVGEDNDHATA